MKSAIYQMTVDDWKAAHYVLELFRMICNHGVVKTKNILASQEQGRDPISSISGDGL